MVYWIDFIETAIVILLFCPQFQWHNFLNASVVAYKRWQIDHCPSFFSASEQTPLINWPPFHSAISQTSPGNLIMENKSAVIVQGDLGNLASCYLPPRLVLVLLCGQADRTEGQCMSVCQNSQGFSLFPHFFSCGYLTSWWDFVSLRCHTICSSLLLLPSRLNKQTNRLIIKYATRQTCPEVDWSTPSNPSNYLTNDRSIYLSVRLSLTLCTDTVSCWRRKEPPLNCCSSLEYNCLLSIFVLIIFLSGIARPVN